MKKKFLIMIAVITAAELPAIPSNRSGADSGWMHQHRSGKCRFLHTVLNGLDYGEWCERALPPCRR